MPTVTALYVFPVKGLKGISLPSAHVCETGVLRFMPGSREECYQCVDPLADVHGMLWVMACIEMIVRRGMCFLILLIPSRISLGPAVDDHKGRRTLPDSEANSQVGLSRPWLSLLRLRFCHCGYGEEYLLQVIYTGSSHCGLLLDHHACMT